MSLFQIEMDEMLIVLYSLMIGSLIDVMVCMRLDITYVVGVITKYLLNFRKNHWKVAKQILSTYNTCLYYWEVDPLLKDYKDLGMTEDLDDK